MRTIEGEAVALLDHAVPDGKTGYWHLRDLHFRDCALTGPACIVPTGDVAITGCAFTAPGGASGVYVLMPTPLVPVGAIVAERVRFERCEGRGLSFLGPEDFVQQAVGDLLG